MITKEVIEDIEIIDVTNKFNHNNFVKTLRIFGVQFYRHSHVVKTTINEAKTNSQIGFSKEK